MPLHSTGEILEVLSVLVEGIGVPNCTIGVPAALTNTVSAFVFVGPQPTTGHTNHTYNRTPRFVIVLGYMVVGAEAGAELKLADHLDALTAKLLSDRTLGGKVQSVVWDTAIGDAAEYRAFAGREFRLYPIVVQIKWTEHYEELP